MNNKIYIFDGNGNKIVASAISDIILSGDSFNNEYIFYTLNEVVNGDLTKVYVAKVNNSNVYIDDNEWENVKRSMLALVHQETVVGLTYGSIVEDNGNVKTFNVQAPRKIALKADKLLGLQDDYKIHSSASGKNDNVPAFGNTEFFDKDALTENKPQASVEVANPFNGSMDPVQINSSLNVPPMANTELTNPVPQTPQVSIPVVETNNSVTVTPVPQTATPTIAPQQESVQAIAPVQGIPTANVEPVATVTIEPVVTTTIAPTATPVSNTTQNDTNVTSQTITGTNKSAPAAVTTSNNQSLGNDLKSLIPTPIPKAIDDSPAVDNRISIVDDENVEEEGGFAIPVKPVDKSMDNMDSVIFDQIIEELNQIKSQNAEIQESIRKLTDNVANINTSLTEIETKESEKASGIINTNTANTTEETPAINLSSNGSVIVPTLTEMNKEANNVINSATNQQIIEQPVANSQILTPTTTNTLIDTSVNNSINTGVNQIISPIANESTTIVRPTPQTIEQPVTSPTPVNVVPTIPVIEPVIQQTTNTPPTVNTSIEQEGNVTYINQEPQLIPNTPMAAAQSKAAEPVIAVPEFDPNAGLPPVIMPQGVSAGDDSSIIGGVM